MNLTPIEEGKVLVNLRNVLQPSPRKRAMLRVRFLTWRISRRAGAWFKRFMDILVSLVVLILLSPMLLIVAILIKLTDGGPVIFWQYRVGKWGTPFRFPKFRSMVVNAEALQEKLKKASQHGDSITFKIKRDPRITWIGRFIRKTSIDELPQLVCVLTGKMSLVGPRPALISEVNQYSLEERRRLDITPGLTCIWQISGRSEIPFAQQCQMDVDYIEQQGILTDLSLLIKTVPAVIVGRGAY